MDQISWSRRDCAALAAANDRATRSWLQFLYRRHEHLEFYPSRYVGRQYRNTEGLSTTFLVSFHGHTMVLAQSETVYSTEICIF